MMALSSYVVNDQADELNPHSRRAPMTALPLCINASITSKKMFIQTCFTLKRPPLVSYPILPPRNLGRGIQSSS
jgi:hypothetical protein